ncbi:MAG: hypothetical protein A2W84_12585 [Bacteroidetes bacterium GWC2_40_13]|nr:MAG: hypothetical protein A2W84_12585 [Bacteroidetes bacterium GWC2_40_13]
MKKQLLLFNLFVLLVCFFNEALGQYTVVNNPINKPGYKLILNDEFNSGPFNDSKWYRQNYYHGEDGAEIQIYVDNLYHIPQNPNYIFRDGKLVLAARKEDPPAEMNSNYKYTSAWFESLAKFKNGYFEIRCKLPLGNSTWPAFWLYTSDSYEKGGHEVDIFEYLGNTPTKATNNLIWMNSKNDGCDCSPNKDRNDYTCHSTGIEFQTPGYPSFADDFHTYALEWSPTFLRFYLDNKVLRTFSNDCRIPRTYMKIIANLTLSGKDGTPPDYSEYSIDYIRAYKKIWCNNFNSKDWSNSYHRRMVGDVNGDGKDDLVGFGWSDVIVAYGYVDNDGPGFRYPHSAIINKDFCYGQGWNVQRDYIYLADVNGDGAKDIVGFGEKGVTVALGEKVSDLQTPQFTTPQLYISNFGTNQGWNKAYHWRMVGDVNGDGKDDLVCFGWSDVIVAYGYVDNNGFGFRYPRSAIVNKDFCYAQNWDVEKHPIYLADMNGDGAKDIVGFFNDGVKVAYGDKNDNLQTPSFTYNKDYYELNDYGCNVSASTNNGFSTTNDVRLVGDANGDHVNDIVAFGNEGVFVTPFTNCNHLDKISSLKSAKLDSNPKTIENSDAINDENEINIFPNPSNGLFSINLSGKSNKTSNVKIYNSLGMKILDSEIQNQKQFDLRRYPKGLYIININVLDNIITSKLIIE